MNIGGYMLNNIAKRLTHNLVNNGIIPSNMQDIYVYGLELLITSLLSTALILIIGIFCGKIVDTITFLILFIGLRSFTGGFHANTYWLCSALTFSIYLTVILISVFVKIPNAVYWLLLPIGLCVLIKKAPIENPNKYLTVKEMRCHKIISIIIFIVALFIGGGVHSIFPEISRIIYYTLLVDLLLMFIKTNYVTNE